MTTACVVILGAYAGRYVLEDDDHFCPRESAFSHWPKRRAPALAFSGRGAKPDELVESPEERQPPTAAFD